METGHIDAKDMMKGGFTLFEFKRFRLHLKDETIILHSDIQDVAENLALAFSACILYVMCEPRFEPPVRQGVLKVARAMMKGKVTMTTSILTPIMSIVIVLGNHLNVIMSKVLVVTFVTPRG